MSNDAKPSIAIDLCFQGWLRGVEVTKLFNVVKSKDVQIDDAEIADLTPKQLSQAINSGVYAVSLDDALDNCCGENEIEIFDVEVTA